MTLIRNPKITHTIEIAEKDLREALVAEAMEQLGLIHYGAPAPGTRGVVTFDGRRGGGTYTISIERDMQIAGQAQLPKPDAPPPPQPERLA